MTSGHCKPEENNHWIILTSVLEVAGQKEPTPSPHPRAYPEPVHGRGYLGGD